MRHVNGCRGFGNHCDCEVETLEARTAFLEGLLRRALRIQVFDSVEEQHDFSEYLGIDDKLERQESDFTPAEWAELERLSG